MDDFAFRIVVILPHTDYAITPHLYPEFPAFLGVRMIPSVICRRNRGKANPLEVEGGVFPICKPPKSFRNRLLGEEMSR
jgi:hypothetical protein